MPVTGSKSLLNYSLSIRLCADGFSFLVSSAGSGQRLFEENVVCQEGEALQAALERGLELPRIKGREYEHVVLYSMSPSTRLPLDEFRREDMLAVYRLTFAGQNTRYDDMRFQLLPALDVVELFTIPNQVENTLHQHYPSAVVKGYYGTLLQNLAETQQGSTRPVTFHAASIDGGIMVVVLRKGKLNFANIFKAQHTADKLYFILYVWKTLNLDAWHDTCFLYGLGDELYTQVRQYLYNVENAGNNWEI